jgi:DNA mismatch repair protein MutL
MNPNPSSSSINILPEFLVNQIKAGEVIERPASLLKELIENSIDASATQIDIHIIDNGLELVSVKDNGKGMTFQELPFAFCRHATSKIEHLEDLYKLSSYGFRGEALASIKSISRLTCRSISKNGDGGKIIFHGSKQISHHPLQNNKPGTSLFIQDLFYNTPVRLKFIKSKISEKNSIKKIIQSFILSSPKVSFTIKWDSKEKEIFKSVKEEDFKERVKKVFFKKNAENKRLLSLKFQYENYCIEGYISQDYSKGHASKSQFLFANQRLFSDKTIHSLITRTMSKIWPEGTSGHYIIKLTLPPHHLDVNIHPRKTQINFLKSSLIYSLISSGLKQVLLKEEPVTQSSNSFNKPNPIANAWPHNEVYQEGHNQDFSRQNDQKVNNHLLFHLSPQFCLLNTRDQNIELIDKGRLILDFCIFHYEKEFPLKEENLTPLLISEPFTLLQIKIPQKSLENLQSFGIDLEYLEKETLILRSIPQFLTKIPYKVFIQSCIKALARKDIQQDINDLTRREQLFQRNYNIFLENFEGSSYDFSCDQITLMRNASLNGSSPTFYRILNEVTLKSFFNFP